MNEMTMVESVLCALERVMAGHVCVYPETGLNESPAHLFAKLERVGLIVALEEDLIRGVRYAPTERGLQFWARAMTARNERKYGPIDVARLWHEDGTGVVRPTCGVGYEISSYFEPHIAAMIKGCRDGLFRFKALHWGHPSFWHMNSGYVVTLTEAGVKYFNSLPRLVEAFE